LAKDLFCPVAILMGVKDPGEWATHLKMMSNPANFLQSLINYDLNMVTKKTLKRVKKYTK